MSDIRDLQRELFGTPPGQTGDARQLQQELFGDSLTADPMFQELIDADSALRQMRAGLVGVRDPDAPSPEIQAMNYIRDLRIRLIEKHGITNEELTEFIRVRQPNVAQGERPGAFRQTVGRIGQGLTNALEPFQLPQQAFYRGLQAQLDAQQAGQGLARQAGTLVGTTFEELFTAEGSGERAAEAFDAFVPRRFRPDEFKDGRRMDDLVAYRDILEQAGVTNETALRWGGLAGDLFADPLLFPLGFRALGKSAQLAARAVDATSDIGRGLNATGNALIRSGDVLEQLTSPLGLPQAAVGAARRVPGVNHIENGLAEVIAAIVETEVPGIAGLGAREAAGGRQRIVGIGRWFSARGQSPLRPGASFLDPGGAGVPEELLQSLSRSEAATNEYVAAVAERFDDMKALLGVERTNSWVGNLVNNVFRRGQGLDESIGIYPEELRLAIQNLGAEVIDNRGILQAPEALEGAGEFVNRFARAFPEDGASLTSQSFREQLELLENFLEPRTSDILESNVSAIRQVAVDAGVDADIAEDVFRRYVDKATEIDALTGFHMSMFPQMQEVFFERLAVKGVNRDEAIRLWQETFAHSNAEGTLDNIGFIQTGDQLEIIGRDNIHLVTRDDNFTTVGELMTNLQRGVQLKLDDYFRALYGGHFRRALAAQQPGQSWAEYLRRLRDGTGTNTNFPNRILDETLATNAVRQAIGNETADKLQRFMTNITPTLPESQGFLVDQGDLMRFLIQDGLSQNEARRVVREIVTVANPQLRDLADRLDRILAPQEIVDVLGAAPRRAPITGTAMTTARTASEQTIHDMGRLYNADVALREPAVSAQRHYPVQQFIMDVARFGGENGLFFDEFPKASRFGNRIIQVPNQPVYGPLAGKWTHRILLREIDNLIVSKAGNRLGGLNTVRSMVTGGLLTGGPGTAVNVVGGFFQAALYGHNPLTLAGDMLGVLRDVVQHGELKNLPDFNLWGDLVDTSGVRREFSRALAESRLPTDQRFLTLGPTMRTFTDVWADFLSRPLGTPENRARRAFSGLFGLDAFEFSENLFKAATFRKVLRESGDNAAAYKAAREIVFDYGQLPEFAKIMRDTGVVPFVGFPTFAMGRTINAALRRPSQVAVADRFSQAFWNAFVPDPEIQARTFAAMDGWQRDDQYAPIRERTDPFGFPILDTIPFNQIIPVAPWAGGFLVEDAGNLGILSGVTDSMISIFQGGETVFGRRTGTPQTFDPTAPLATKMTQWLQFVYNNYAPRVLTRTFQFERPLSAEGPGGIVGTAITSPELRRTLEDVPFLDNIIRPLPADYEMVRMFNDMRRGKLRRDTFGEVVTALFRSVRPITTSPFSPAVLGRDSIAIELDNQINQLRRKQSDIERDPNLSFEERARQSGEIGMEIARLRRKQFDRVGRILGIEGIEELPPTFPEVPDGSQ